MSDAAPRRVIPIKVEPASALSAGERSAVLDACARLKSLPGALLPILHAVQAALGFVPKDAVPLIARELNQSIAEVHGVLSFYHYFRHERGGRHVLFLCRAEACQAQGGVGLEAHAKTHFGRRLSRHHFRWGDSPRAGLLPGQLRARAFDDDR